MTVTTTAGVTSGSIDGTAGGTTMSADNPYIYVDLKTGTRVDVNDLDARASATWDIALKRSSLRVNSGDSGTGNRKLAVVQAQTLAEVTAVPTSGYAVDDFADTSCKLVELLIGEPSSAFGQWYDYNDTTHMVSPKREVYVIERPDGSHGAAAHHLLRRHREPDARRLLPGRVEAALSPMAAPARRLRDAVPATAAALAATAVLAAAAPAHAARPVLARRGHARVTSGDLLVHYATTARTRPAADANADGVPDFVESVAQIAEAALDQLVALGFRRPLSDTAIDGDARIDIYLRDLVSADGSAGTDSCTGDRCVGYVVAENDYAGYSYPSVEEGIRSVVPHEIFHLIQNAYAAGQPSSWTEGSAVWAVEQLYGAGNSDFERFLPSFLQRSFRPPRARAGRLRRRVRLRRRAVAVLPGAPLSSRAPSSTRGRRARPPSSSRRRAAVAPARLEPRGRVHRVHALEPVHRPARRRGGGSTDAAAWPTVPLEPAATGAARIFIEGLSAQYLPITVGEGAARDRAPAGGSASPRGSSRTAAPSPMASASRSKTSTPPRSAPGLRSS